MKKVHSKEHLDIIKVSSGDVASFVMIYPEPAYVLQVRKNLSIHFSSAQFGYAGA
jgi:hypothetical protein